MYRLGLIGYPLEHSLSPVIQNAALAASGLAGEYKLYPTPPLPEGAETLRELLIRVSSGELNGLNVTIPHKQSVISGLDELTPAVRHIGAVNTIYGRRSQLIGDNSDAPGFMADLKRFEKETEHDATTSLKERQIAIVLGAGGSARAIIYGLIQAGWQVVVAARREEQAQEVISDLSRITSNHQIRASHLNGVDLANLSEMVSLIVNTTPVGMHPHTESSPWPEEAPFPRGAIVYDLVYNPAETKLMRTAQQAGLPATSGIGMLVEQAALAFELWTGCEAPRNVMLKAARKQVQISG